MNIPATTSTSCEAAIDATAEAQGPSRGSANALSDVPKHAIVASGNSTTEAPAVAAAATSNRINARFASGDPVDVI